VLEIDGLDVVYHAPPLEFHALRDVGVVVKPGEIVAVIGESGCGKSTLASAALGLLPGNAEIRSGRVMLEGTDIVDLDEEGLRRMRGRRVALIPQDPLQSLNPTLTVGRQMADAVLAHADRRGRDKRGLQRQMVTMLQRVGIPDAADRLGKYPHQFSGGMRQRILIATALMLGPAMLVADEPTSALDVTLEAQILQLLRRLRDERGTSILFVTHNVGVVAQLVDRVVVMYAGRVVESAEVNAFFAGARHPYAQALLGAVPTHEHRNRRLTTIPGRVPSLAQLPVGCAFADRCQLVAPVCRAVDPAPVTDGDSRVRCHARDPRSGWRAPAGVA
jgi:oligopeptide/dipeptide ABC transporter ATP-binding protein